MSTGHLAHGVMLLNSENRGQVGFNVTGISTIYGLGREQRWKKISSESLITNTVTKCEGTAPSSVLKQDQLGWTMCGAIIVV